MNIKQSHLTVPNAAIYIPPEYPIVYVDRLNRKYLASIDLSRSVYFLKVEKSTCRAAHPSQTESERVMVEIRDVH